jgi:hypothetical protein
VISSKTSNAVRSLLIDHVNSRDALLPALAALTGMPAFAFFALALLPFKLSTS